MKRFSILELFNVANKFELILRTLGDLADIRGFYFHYILTKECNKMEVMRK